MCYSDEVPATARVFKSAGFSEESDCLVALAEYARRESVPAAALEDLGVERCILGVEKA